MTNITSIAKALNISPSTVSRALKKPEMVSLKTRNLILHEAKAQGYLTEDKGSVETFKGRDNLIGILVADLNNSFSDQIVSAVQDVAYAHDFVPLIGCTYERPAQESKIIRQWQDLGLKGIVAMPTHNFSHLESLFSDLKVVLVDRDLENFQADKVLDDNFLGMKLALDHLHELGHEKIAVLYGSTNVYTFKARSEAAASIKSDCELIEINAVSYEELYMGAFEQLNILFMRDKARRPTAILASNNAIAAGCLYAASLKGITMSQDLSLIAFGDSHWMRFYPTPVSAVRQPVTQMGTKAAYMLLERIKGNTQEFKTEVLEPMLMPRSSTGQNVA